MGGAAERQAQQHTWPGLSTVRCLHRHRRRGRKEAERNRKGIGKDGHSARGGPRPVLFVDLCSQTQGNPWMSRCDNNRRNKGDVAMLSGGTSQGAGCLDRAPGSIQAAVRVAQTLRVWLNAQHSVGQGSGRQPGRALLRGLNSQVERCSERVVPLAQPAL